MPGNMLSAELASLQTLYSNGDLTEEQFRAAKTKVLAKAGVVVAKVDAPLPLADRPKAPPTELELWQAKEAARCAEADAAATRSRAPFESGKTPAMAAVRWLQGWCKICAYSDMIVGRCCSGCDIVAHYAEAAALGRGVRERVTTVVDSVGAAQADHVRLEMASYDLQLMVQEQDAKVEQAQQSTAVMDNSLKTILDELRRATMQVQKLVRRAQPGRMLMRAF
jgi:hypothetical protein